MTNLTPAQCLAWKRAGFPQEIKAGDWIYLEASIEPLLIDDLNISYFVEHPDYVRIPTLGELLDFVKSKDCSWELEDDEDENGNSVCLCFLSSVQKSYATNGRGDSPILALHRACVEAGIVEEEYEDGRIRIPSLEELLAFVEGLGWRPQLTKIDESLVCDDVLVLKKENGWTSLYTVSLQNDLCLLKAELGDSWLAALHAACVEAGIVEEVEK